ncbi:hypothetical protein BwSH12_77920 [Bradyrhizobium ottawaense]|nr:hypothetical protein BwSH12_77920 [Bradyrhizobium ottawaense]
MHCINAAVRYKDKIAFWIGPRLKNAVTIQFRLGPSLGMRVESRNIFVRFGPASANKELTDKAET